MSESKHTPGPWIVTKERSHPHSKTNVGSGVYGSVASCYGCRPSPEENAANARLIAAAPDLLEACFEALAGIMGEREGLGDLVRCQRMLRQAIRKATGE